MTAIAPGTPVVSAHGIEARVTRLTPHQPEGGFASIDDAVQWKQAQLWFDRDFSHQSPRAAAVVTPGADGYQLLELDRTLRIAAGGDTNVSVGAWSKLDDRIASVIDGLGARLPSAGAIGAHDALEGVMLSARPGSPAAVALDGANPATRRLELLMPNARMMAVAGVAALAVGGVTAYQVLKD